MHAVAQHSFFNIKLFKDVFPNVAASKCVFPTVGNHFVPRVSWLVSPLVGKAYCQYSSVILLIAIILSVFAFARLLKLMVEWRSSMISWGPLSLLSNINFGGALLLNELSYASRIGCILKSKDDSLKWDQSEVSNFICLGAVLL